MFPWGASRGILILAQTPCRSGVSPVFLFITGLEERVGSEPVSIQGRFQPRAAPYYRASRLFEPTETRLGRIRLAMHMRMHAHAKTSPNRE